MAATPLTPDGEIVSDPDLRHGEPVLAGTATPVRAVAELWNQGMSPEEIEFQHYGQPSLSQIHAALAYYYDHQAEFDAEIERRAEEYETLRAQAMDSPGRRRLRAMGKLP